MKFLGVLIIGLLLSSYLPLEAIGHCSEEEHSVDKRMGCGYLFHCPFTSDTNESTLSIPYLNGWLIQIPKIEKLEEPVITIYHPPKKYYKYNLTGMKEFGTNNAYKIGKD